MEKLNIHQNGQWDLEKAEIDKSGYKYKHRSTHNGSSVYTISHKEHGNVGHGVVGSDNKPKATLNDKFASQHPHILTSLKAFHIARNTKTDN